MAKSQTRRTVSLNRTVYDTALAHAHARNQSLSELVTASLRAAGVAIPETEHFVAEHAKRVAEGKLRTPEERRERERLRGRARYRAKVMGGVAGGLRPGPIRKALGDQIADMCGEP